MLGFLRDWRVAAALTAFLAIGAALVGWRTLSTAASGGDGGLPQLASQQFASRVLHYTLIEYTNYEVRGSALPVAVQSAQTTLVTERWVQLDDTGNQFRFKTTTRLPSGEIWQERLYRDSTEVVNWYQYPGSAAACSQTSRHSEAAGSSLPFANKDQLASAGFSETDRPTDLAQAGAPAGARSFEKNERRSPAPGFLSGRSVIVRDRRTDQRTADLFFGADAHGHEVLYSPPCSRR
ncbi:MAG: hypothetical protein ABIQ34_04560 [Tepidiformaceae bacterium]